MNRNLTLKSFQLTGIVQRCKESCGIFYCLLTLRVTGWVPLISRRSILMLVVCLLPTALLTADERSDQGQLKVSIIDGEWVDFDRQGRVIPWKLYLPELSSGRAPLVIHSHGGGGSRNGNSVLGHHLATYGFASLHIQHPGTDSQAVRRKPQSIVDAANDPVKAADRFRDVGFVVKQLKETSASDPVLKMINADLIGISGHSLGGITSQVIAGQKIAGFDQTLAIPSLKGAFVLSSSPPRAGFGHVDQAIDSLLMPIFFLTGTADSAPDKSFTAADRQIPFHKSHGVDRWLLVIDGATHFTFSGNETVPRTTRFVPGMEADPNLRRNHDYLKAAAVAFWQFTLNEDQAAFEYLTEGGLKRFVGEHGTVDFAPATK